MSLSLTIGKQWQVGYISRQLLRFYLKMHFPTNDRPAMTTAGVFHLSPAWIFVKYHDEFYLLQDGPLLVINPTSRVITPVTHLSKAIYRDPFGGPGHATSLEFDQIYMNHDCNLLPMDHRKRPKNTPIINKPQE